MGLISSEDSCAPPLLPPPPADFLGCSYLPEPKEEQE